MEHWSTRWLGLFHHQFCTKIGHAFSGIALPGFGGYSKWTHVWMDLSLLCWLLIKTIWCRQKMTTSRGVQCFPTPTSGKCDSWRERVNSSSRGYFWPHQAIPASATSKLGFSMVVKNHERNISQRITLSAWNRNSDKYTFAGMLTIVLGLWKYDYPACHNNNLKYILRKRDEWESSIDKLRKFRLDCKW